MNAIPLFWMASVGAGELFIGKEGHALIRPQRA
jgi:hypothetical protein